MEGVMSDEPNLPVEPDVPAPAASGQPPLSRGQKARDFMIGFFGGLALNIVLGLLFYAFQGIQDRMPSWLSILLQISGWLAPWILNFSLIVLALVGKRNWIALGVLGLMMIPILLMIILFVFVMVACLAGGLVGL
jgi:hypothetical protein